ncbi:YopT-type cysteine protease domain-containing protein [Elioraea rosea]|uniref:YopT-type cysteine protease domain-containing protein n=1 Tax=Elioraea rosea TaxID=2492390 RepID=UPI001182FF98|nr:YopT-type cysteine protease domain-containing protein [Elioraea rosea]
MLGPLNTAEASGGRVKHAFRQGDVESYGWTNLDPLTRPGACIALSCWWLVKARKGEDFYGWVRTPSGIKAINQMQASPSFGEGPNRIENRIRFLEGHGLTRIGQTTLTIEPLNMTEVANELYELGYKQISFRGGGEGHAVAAVVADARCRFFDPNYGEVEFTDRGAFSNWFIRYWMAADLYNATLGESCRIIYMGG